MNLFTIHFSELEHLPVEQREEIVRRALESAEMARFRRIASQFVGLSSSLMAIGLTSYAVARQLNQWILLLAFIALLVVIALEVVAKFYLEVRLLRRLIKRDIDLQPTAQ